ncbi:tRNA(Ile)-lysidine synthase [Pasteurellaceae bacterium Pebbles2]|nr:tRNA(Ile)-lysidine synthase [Pasteurellaceae bacterium Pebbles2]
MNLIDFFQTQLTHSQYLIALSGGLDSTALLALLAKSRKNQPHLQLRAIHIHHGLSPNADEWASHCERLCQQFDIPLIVKKVQVNQQNGIENGAREARYQAIAQVRFADEIVVTAHHLQDQTETFFLALKRGSGLKGLGAIQTYSTLYGIPLFRPLLACSRQQLESYIQTLSLPWIEDESNADNRYDRNFLRNKILPELRQRWQNFDQLVARSAQHCFEQQQLIEELLREPFQQNYDEIHRTFSLQCFAQYSKSQQNALLRMWLNRQNHPMPSLIQLEQMKQDVIFARPDATPQYQLGEKMVRRYQQKLYLTPHFQTLDQLCLPIAIGEKIKLPDQLGELELQKNAENLTALWYSEQGIKRADLPLTTAKIQVKFAYSGKVRLSPTDLNRELKKVWQSLQVPTWQRQRIPLIFYGEQLKSAVGFFDVF